MSDLIPAGSQTARPQQGCSCCNLVVPFILAAGGILGYQIADRLGSDHPWIWAIAGGVFMVPCLAVFMWIGLAAVFVIHHFTKKGGNSGP